LRKFAANGRSAAAKGSTVITFEQARAIGASSPEVYSGIRPAASKLPNGATRTAAIFILVGRSPGQPWWHGQLPDAPIPGPPMMVVSKSTGVVRTFVGAMVPEYFRETDDEPRSPIGDVPEELIESSE